MLRRAEASQRALLAAARFDARARLVRTTRCHWSYKDSRGTQGAVIGILQSRDSPDEPRTAANIRAVPAFRQDRRAARAAAVTLGRPNGCRAADPAIFRDI